MRHHKPSRLPAHRHRDKNHHSREIESQDGGFGAQAGDQIGRARADEIGIDDRHADEDDVEDDEYGQAAESEADCEAEEPGRWSGWWGMIGRGDERRVAVVAGDSPGFDFVVRRESVLRSHGDNTPSLGERREEERERRLGEQQRV